MKDGAVAGGAGPWCPRADPLVYWRVVGVLEVLRRLLLEDEDGLGVSSCTDDFDVFMAFAVVSGGIGGATPRYE